MPKAKSHPDQLGFLFEAPRAPVRAHPDHGLPVERADRLEAPAAPIQGEAALMGLEKRINSVVGTILNSDARPREVIAAQMTVLLGEEVSRAMLDAYASPARDGHRVPFSRLLALVAVTNRQDQLDPLVREVGAAILVGEEVHTARLGHLDRQIEKLKAERAQVARSAPLIRGGI